MTMTFTKMHGLGNDFMVVNALEQPFKPNSTAIQQLANRHTGIGFDQLLIISKANDADFFCHIYNSNGSEAEQCGNGLRCVARYLYENGIAQNKLFTIATIADNVPVTVNNIDNITVSLPPPGINHEEVALSLKDDAVSISTLTLGNPHAIVQINQIDESPIATLGELISTHPHFNCGANVGFMEIIDRNHIRLRTHERGAGMTHACGTNACAAVIVGIQQGLLNNDVTVSFPLGDLQISWDGANGPVHMTGPAITVYQGQLEESGA